MILAMVACMEVGLPAMTENTSSRAARESRCPSNQATTLISAQKVMSVIAACVRIGKSGRWTGRARASERGRFSLFSDSNPVYSFLFPAVEHAVPAIKGGVCALANPHRFRVCEASQKDICYAKNHKHQRI
jgi:hypothetical protein